MNLEFLYQLYLSCDCRVTTDSRSIEGGELFFALKGERFDGNLYALDALNAGAAYAIIDSKTIYANSGEHSLKERLILVDNVFSCLQALATHHRRTVCSGSLPVLALTGTNGKTTTKNLITVVLSTRFRVCATKGNFNNDIGVPLTLLSIRPDTEFAIIEMGANHPDDIAKLVRVCEPDFGLITNVGKAHLEGFGSFEGVKNAKGELYKWLSGREGSRIFINEDDSHLKEMSEGIASHFYEYGINYQGARIIAQSPERPLLSLQLADKTIHTQLIGTYNATNVLAALCVGQFFGVSRDAAITAIEAYYPSNQRSQLERAGSNTLIIDAYNANPSSMAAALDGFLATEAKHKLALLGDMKELGADSQSEHLALLERLCGTDVDVMLVGDEFCNALSSIKASHNCKVPQYLCFKTSTDLAYYLSSHLPVDSLILIKGSRSTAMEKVLDALRK